MNRSSIGSSCPSVSKSASVKPFRQFGSTASATTSSTKSRSDFRSTIINRSSESKVKSGNAANSNQQREELFALSRDSLSGNGYGMHANTTATINSSPSKTVPLQGLKVDELLSEVTLRSMEQAKTFETRTTNHQSEGVLESTLFEQEIEKKLILIDEATITSQIIEERSISIENLRREIVDMNSMYVNLSKIVHLQHDQVSSVSDVIDLAHDKAESALNSTLNAQKVSKTGGCIIS